MLHRFTCNTARGWSSRLFGPKSDTTTTTPYHHESHDGTAVPECYKDGIESQWKNLKFDPRHPKLAEPMVTKTGRIDYISCKIHVQNCITICLWDFAPHVWEVAYPMFTRLVFWFFQLATPRLLRQFWRSVRQKTSFHTRMCLLGSKKSIFTFRPHFPSKTQIFDWFSTRQISARNGL